MLDSADEEIQIDKQWGQKTNYFKIFVITVPGHRINNRRIVLHSLCHLFLKKTKRLDRVEYVYVMVEASKNNLNKITLITCEETV